MIKSQVIILGGGVSGIACARALQAANVDYLLIEASGRLGGRLKSDQDSGYIFDHGFQVFLSGYEITKSLIDDKLELSSFSPGALLILDGQRYRISDPFREPALMLSTLKAPIGSFWDKLLMLRLKLISSQASWDPGAHELIQHFKNLHNPPSPTNHLNKRDLSGQEISLERGASLCSPSKGLGRANNFLNKILRDVAGGTHEGLTTAEYLKSLGFSDRIINTFFKPFLSGIFLDESLSTSADLFLQVFGNFSRGEAQLPDGGMEALARSLAAPLDQSKIMLNQRVVNFTADKVVLESGEMLQARSVVSALDVDSLRSLKPYLELPRSNSVSCFYYASDPMPELGKYLVLNSAKYQHPLEGARHRGSFATGNSDRLINNIAPLSNINPSYAPEGKINLSVSVLGEFSDEQKIKAELEEMFPGKRFEFLRRYVVKGALPDQGVGGKISNPSQLHDSELMLCGDFFQAGYKHYCFNGSVDQRRRSASIETAVISGMSAAARVISQVS